jgi:hypothetical protein
MPSTRACLFTPLLLLLPSCATIVAGGPDMVPVSSKPEGARVLLDGQAVGTTPTTVTFARSCKGVLTFQLAGYETKTVDIDKQLNGWLFGNILFGGLIGIAVDAISGAAGKYPTTPVHVELSPAPKAP